MFRPKRWVDRVGVPEWTDWLSELPEAADGKRRTRRADLLAMPASEPDELARLLVGAYVCGTGGQAWLVGRRTRVFRGNKPERIREALAGAGSVLGTDGPVAAYRSLNSGDGALKYLGPPFFTKLLYFADPSGQALILDRFVASALRRTEGWPNRRYGWTSIDYERRLGFPHAAATSYGVRPDAIEAAYFASGKHRS